MIFLYLVREIGREGKKCVAIRTECSVFFPARSARSRTKKDASRIRLASRIIMLLCAAQEKAAQSACAKENTAVSAKNLVIVAFSFPEDGCSVAHIISDRKKKLD